MATDQRDGDVGRLAAAARAEYRKRFGDAPKATAVAPGRVEVLGNHTDYNGGYVLSAAIDKRTCVAIAPQEGDRLTADVLDGNDRAETTLAALARADEHDWANYSFGVVDQIRKLPNAPQLGGMKIGVLGEVPIGAGLSSSAALEVSTALAIQALYPFEIDKMALAQLCQRAENQFVGVSSGLMDQFSSVFGEPDHLLFLDCLTLRHEALAVAGQPVSLVVCNSMVKHALTGGEYNSRRAECESAARKLGQKLLRDVTPEMLESGRDKLTENEYKRARHVVMEDERVLKARDAVRAGDVQALGRLMNESHESSRTSFENSTPELDRLSDIARSLPGCYGARLTGGGFGGCVLSLVESSRAEEFSREIAERYGKTIDRAPDVFICKIGGGAVLVPVEG